MGTFKDYIKLHFIVFLWGFTAILGRLITIPSVEIVFYRTLITVATLAVLLFFWKVSFKIGKSGISKSVLTGFIISAHWILFFASASVSNISICLAGISTITLWTSIIDPIWNRTKFKTLDLIIGLVIIGGLYIIFSFEFDHALGLGMAVVSAFLASLFTVINADLAQEHDAYMITFYEMVGACICTALFFPIYVVYFAPEGLQLVPANLDWLYLVILAVACTVYAYSVSVELMKRVTAYIMNLTVNLEPIYGIIMAFFLFSEEEKMTSGFYMGALIILAAVLSYPMLNRTLERRLLKVDNLR